MGAATLAALKAASGDTPLVLAVDDVQWLDPASGGALAFALRRLTDDRVVLFATRRAGPGAEQLDLGCGMRGALRLTEEGIAIQAASYGEQAQGSLAWGRALVAVYLGDVQLARELAERALAQSEALCDGIFAAANSGALGFLDFSVGDNAAAVERFRPLIDRYLGGDAGEPGLRPNVFLPDAIEALVALGQKAEELLSTWEDAGRRFERPRIHATAARCRALLWAACDDLEAAVRHAEAALEHHRDLPVPFERARTLIVFGTLHRRAKHKAAARAALEEAIEILDWMGAPLWAERARAELDRIGGRRRRAVSRRRSSASRTWWQRAARTSRWRATCS